MSSERGAGRPARVLVVTADDFGISEGVNAGVVRSFERGIVTGASLMVRQRAAAKAASRAGSLPGLAVGLHLDLEERDYGRGGGGGGGSGGGGWRCDRDDPRAVEAECRAQLERFRGLVGRDPTHLDSHHHLHLEEPLAGVAGRLATELGVPLRGRGIRYEGRFHGRGRDGRPDPEAVGVEALIAILRSLPVGVTELGCHPGSGEAGSSSYREERRREVQSLCDPAVREAVVSEGIGLASFADLGA